MDDEELEKIKQQKRKELEKQMGNQDIEQQKEQMEKIKQQRKQQLRKILTRDAYERFNRVRIINEDMSNQLETYLIKLKQMGQINQKINEEQLKKILKSLRNNQKTDWNIKRR